MAGQTQQILEAVEQPKHPLRTDRKEVLFELERLLAAGEREQ